MKKNLKVNINLTNIDGYKAKDERQLVAGRGGEKFVKQEVKTENWIILYGTKPGK